MLYQPVVSNPVQKSQSDSRNDRQTLHDRQPFGLLLVQGVEAFDDLVARIHNLALRLVANHKKDRPSVERKLEVADRCC